MKNYKIKVQFRGWPFPKTFLVTGHSVNKELQMLELSLADSGYGLYAMNTIKAFSVGQDFKDVMQARTDEQEKLRAEMEDALKGRAGGKVMNIKREKPKG